MLRGDKCVVVQWVGDISLNAGLCSPQCHEPIRSQMAILAHEAGPCDLRVGNFEAPLWGDGSVNHIRKTRICTTKEAAESILPLGLNVVFLGNNHVYDCRERGFKNTTDFLRAKDIRYLGAGFSPQEASRPIIFQTKVGSVGVLNYLHQNTNPTLPSDARIFPNYFDEETALKAIADLSSEVDVLLLYLHWGEELIRLPSPAQRRFGRRAVEAGATVVMFDHAHCLQPHEPWRNGHIFYGLGNFIFGDVDDEAWPSVAWSTAIAEIEITCEGVQTVSFQYLFRQNGIPRRTNQKAIARSHRRLNWCLRIPGPGYSLIYRWERLYQLGIMCCLRFIGRSGGVLPAMFSLRKRHFVKILKAAVKPLRKLG